MPLSASKVSKSAHTENSPPLGVSVEETSTVVVRSSDMLSNSVRTSTDPVSSGAVYVVRARPKLSLWIVVSARAPASAPLETVNRTSSPDAGSLNSERILASKVAVPPGARICGSIVTVSINVSTLRLVPVGLMSPFCSQPNQNTMVASVNAGSQTLIVKLRLIVSCPPPLCAVILF